MIELTHRTSLRLSVLLAVLLASAGCDAIAGVESDESDPPTVSYPNTTIAADFYQPGSSGSPNIDWGGSQGAITLGTDLEGLSINSTTGRLDWTKLLPAGTHDVEVVVSNSNGQVAVPVTLQNPLSGRFEGTYSGGSYYVLDVDDDGTLTVLANSSTSPDEGEGTWSVIDGSYVFEFVYTATDEEYYVIADLEQTNDAATLEGDWYFGTYTPDGSPGGSVLVSIE